jgi:DNA invertase Pin-like site-specific DNA recombinase
MTVGLYARLSPKPNGRGYEGVDDQITWGTTYAATAWPGQPVEVFADRGKSAGRDDVRRDDFERLRQWVNDGKLTHLWTVEQSRITRREIEWFEFAADLDAAGITEMHTNRDGIVQVRDEVAGIKAVLAAGERRKMLRRLHDTLTEKAAKGEPPGVRPFGYVHAVTEDGTRTYDVVPEQALAITFAAEKVLAGWSLASIAADLREQGVRGTHGGQVASGTVKGWLTSPSIAGQRVHSGQVVGTGNWPAILDLATFKAVGARLGGSRTVQRKDGGTYVVSEVHRKAPGRRYLLTGGLAVCDVCQAPLVGSVKQLRKGSKPYLLCHPKVGGRGCLGVMLPEVEDHVLAELWARLDSPEFLEALADDGDHEEERARLVTLLDGIDGQRRELAGMWGRRELTTAEWQTAKAEVDELERQANADLAVIPVSSVPVDIAEAREDWQELTLDEQRAFIRRYVDTVTIRRATRHGRPGLDTERVDIAWRKAR